MFTMNIHKNSLPQNSENNLKINNRTTQATNATEEMHDPNPRSLLPFEEPRCGGHPEAPGALAPWKRSYIFDEESCSMLPPKIPKSLLNRSFQRAWHKVACGMA